MNLHPLFVHFPIAFLTLYSILELVSFREFARSAFVFQAKALLVMVGVVAALATLQTGEMIEHQFMGTPTESLMNLHSTLANAVTYLYLVIGLCYLVAVINRQQLNTALPSWAVGTWRVITSVQRVVLNPWIAKLLALIAVGMLMIVGALGGAIVYGPDVDPAVNFVYHLFFAQ